MTSISYVQAVIAMQASSNADSKSRAGHSAINRANQERQRLQKEIDKKEAQIQKLSDEVKEASDTSAWDDFCNFFTGSNDRELADLNEDLSIKSAEMKKAMSEVAVAQEKIENQISELQSAQQEFAQRSSDRDKTYDEAAQTAKMI